MRLSSFSIIARTLSITKPIHDDPERIAQWELDVDAVISAAAHINPKLSEREFQRECGMEVEANEV